MQEHVEETTQPAPEPISDVRESRALAFAKRHPALTVIGAAGVGLIGGLELAAGVLIGAGVAAMVRGRNAQSSGAVSSEARVLRARARGAIERARPEVRKRVRAIVQAARGKLEPTPAT